MKAYLKNYRQSPRKVRLVASLIKGMPVENALAELDFLAKRAGSPIRTLLVSAIANAVNNSGMQKENLFVKEVTVDKGIVMKRSMPRAMGSASKINKRTSHIMLTLMEKESNKKSATEKTAEKTKIKKVKTTAKVVKSKTVKK